VSGKTLKTLRDGEVIDHFEHVSEDLERYAYGLHLMGVIYHFAQHDHDHEKLFQFLLKIMKVLNTNNQFEAYVIMTELKLLYLLGVQPLLKHCVFCESTSHLSFSVKDGGMVCQEHGGKITYEAAIIKDLMYLYYFDTQKQTMKEIEKSHLIQLRKLIDAYYAYHLNFKSKSRQMITEIFGY